MRVQAQQRHRAVLRRLRSAAPRAAADSAAVGAGNVTARSAVAPAMRLHFQHQLLAARAAREAAVEVDNGWIQRRLLAIARRPSNYSSNNNINNISYDNAADAAPASARESWQRVWASAAAAAAAAASARASAQAAAEAEAEVRRARAAAPRPKPKPRAASAPPGGRGGKGKKGKRSKKAWNFAAGAPPPSARKASGSKNNTASTDVTGAEADGDADGDGDDKQDQDQEKKRSRSRSQSKALPRRPQSAPPGSKNQDSKIKSSVTEKDDKSSARASASARAIAGGSASVRGRSRSGGAGGGAAPLQRPPWSLKGAVPLTPATERRRLRSKSRSQSRSHSRPQPLSRQQSCGGDHAAHATSGSAVTIKRAPYLCPNSARRAAFAESTARLNLALAQRLAKVKVSHNIILIYLRYSRSTLFRVKSLRSHILFLSIFFYFFAPQPSYSFSARSPSAHSRNNNNNNSAYVSSTNNAGVSHPGRDASSAAAHRRDPHASGDDVPASVRQYRRASVTALASAAETHRLRRATLTGTSATGGGMSGSKRSSLSTGVALTGDALFPNFPQPQQQQQQQEQQQGQQQQQQQQSRRRSRSRTRSRLQPQP